MKRALTDALIRTVAAPDKGSVELADLEMHGPRIPCDVEPGEELPYFRFRDPQSRRPTYATIGRYPDVTLSDARKAADSMRRQVAAGTNPIHREKRQERHDARARTFQTLSDRYLAGTLRARFKRSHPPADERNLRLHILPARTGSDPQAWKDRRYTSIRRSDVIELVEGLIKAGKPTLANCVQALVSGIYSFAVDADLVGSHPCARRKSAASRIEAGGVHPDDEIRLVLARDH